MKEISAKKVPFCKKQLNNPPPPIPALIFEEQHLLMFDFFSNKEVVFSFSDVVESV